MNKFFNNFDWIMIKGTLYVGLINLGIGIGASNLYMFLLGLVAVLAYPFLVKINLEFESMNETFDSRQDKC